MASTLNLVFSLLLVVYVFFELASVIKRTSLRIIVFFYIFFTLIHFGFSYVYLSYLDTVINIPDAITYYNKALVEQNWFDSFGIGSQFISFLIYPFVHLKIRIEVLFLLFSTISFKGFLIYFEILDINKRDSYNQFLLLFYFLPTLHFWTGSIGKEALLFYLMAVLLNKVKFKSLNFSTVLLFLLVFFIRPHVFFVLVLVLLLLFYMDKKVGIVIKKKILLCVFLSIIFLFPLSLKYFLKIDSLNYESLENYFFKFLDYSNTLSGSSISLINSNIITRIFYLVFMPLPFLYDIKNKWQCIVSIENVFFIFGFIYSIYSIFKKGIKWRNLNQELRFVLITSLFLIVLFGSYLYNLGLGNRMRIMFLPYILYFFIRVLSAKNLINDKS